MNFRLTLDRNNQLRDDGKHLRTALLEHVENTLHGKESVWVLLLTNAFEEDWQVVVVVKLGHVDLPVDFVLRAVVDRNW